MKTCSNLIINLALLCWIFLNPGKVISVESNQGPFLVLNNPVNAGFGAIFSSVLSTLHIYDVGNYAGLKIDLNSGIYVDPQHGPNWWNYFFEPIHLGDEKAPQQIFSDHEVSYLINAGFVIPRPRAFELIQKYVHLKPPIQTKIDQFINHEFKHFFIIGIHHRGTDKKLEAPLVSYETILRHLRWWLAKLKKDTPVKIFVATDDQNFLDYLCHLYPGQVCYNKFVRSKDETPLHYNDHLFTGNYQKGEEAILDCLLLSKCQLLLFPAASAFSMASLKFNPDLIAIPLAGN